MKKAAARILAAAFLIKSVPRGAQHAQVHF
jgi:hypothetical protein